MKKQEMGKRFRGRIRAQLALIMALVMLVSCLPTVSLAAKVQWTNANVKHGEENEWVYGSTPPEPVITCFEGNNQFTYQGDGEITYSYQYGDPNGAGYVPTTPENSGAAQTGGFPVFAGSYSVKATIAETATYAGGTAEGEITILPANPTADLFDVSVSPNAVYDGQNKTVTLSAKSTVVGMGDITIDAVTDKNGAAVNSNQIVHPGEYTITFSIANGRNYNDKDNLTTTFTIQPKETTITGLTVDSKEYDGTTGATFTGTPALSGIVSGDDVSVLPGTATFEDENVGENKTVSFSGFSLEGNDAYNYTLTQPTATGTITKRSVVVSGIVAEDKTYDGETAATLDFSKATVSNLMTGDTLTVTAEGVFEDADVGNNKEVAISKLALDGANVAHYQLASGSQQTSATAAISKRDATVTANAQEITYGSEIAQGTNQATLTGAVSGHTLGEVTLTASGSDVTTSGTVTPGGAKILDANSKDVTDNYNIKYTTGALTVSKADQTAPAAPTLADASADHITLTAIANGQYSIGDTEHWQEEPTFSGLTKNTGYTFYQRYAGDKEHNPSPASDAATISTTDHAHEWSYAAAGATITATCADTDGGHGDPKTATITIIAPTLTKEGETGNAEAVIEGSIPGITPKIVYKKGVTVLTAAPTTGGSYTASVTLSDETGAATASVSYKIQGIAPLTVAGITANSKEYDGTTEATLSGLERAHFQGIVVGHENVSLKQTQTVTAAFEDAKAGTGKRVIVTGYVLSGSDRDYYLFTQPELTADITPKEVTVTGITAEEKRYDGNTTATLDLSNAVVEGELGNDDLKVSAATGVFEDAKPNPNARVLISGITLTGTGAENYIAKDTITQAMIYKKSLNIIGLTAVSKIYDGTTDATLTGTPAIRKRDIVGEDDVRLIGTATGVFLDGNVGERIIVNVNGLSLTGENEENYILTTPQVSLRADILKREVTVEAKPQTIVLGDSISTGMEWATLTGAVEGHTLAAVTLTASINEQSTSQGTITPSAATIWDVAGNDVTGNYEITYAGGALTVNKPKKEAPAAPTLASVTATSITLNAADGCEYSMDLAAWQAETTFSGLESSKTYTFYQRYKEDAEHDASDPSEGAAFKTVDPEKECSLTFVANGGVGTMDPIRALEGAGAKLPKNAFAKDAYGFNGWNTAPDGSGKAYGDEETVILASDMTLYAQWFQYTVTFDAQNGKAAVSLAAIPNQPIGKPEDPTMEGYTFRGWFVLQDGTAKAYDFSAPVSGNLTLWGCWNWPKTIEIPRSRTYLLTAPMKNMTFTSSSPEDVAVSDAGEISALVPSGFIVTIDGFLHPGVPACSWPVKVMPYGFELSESQITIEPKGSGSFRITQYYLSGDSIERVTSGDPSKLAASFEGDVITVESLSSESGSYYVYVLNRAGQNTKSVLVTVEKAPVIQLSATKVSVKDQETATVTVKKYSAENDAIETVESNNPEIATATFNGNKITVKAVGNGKATISVITKKGAVGKITANVNNTKVAFTRSSVTISGSFSVNIKARDLDDDTIQKVESDDESVATATFKDNIITITPVGFGANGKGETEINVTTRDGARGSIKVKVKSLGVKFENNKITIQGLGTKKTNVKLVVEGDALKKVKSSNEQIFTATFKGNQITLTGWRFGDAYLTAYTKKGGMQCVKVTVENSRISLTPNSLTINGIKEQTVTMDSTVDEDTVESVIFTYAKAKSKQNVLSARYDGKEIIFTPKKAGTAEATVTAYGGGTKKIKLTVQAATLTLSPNELKLGGKRQKVKVTSDREGDTISRVKIDDETVVNATFKGNTILVTPVGTGGTDIHVTSREGGLAALHVKVSDTKIKLAVNKNKGKIDQPGSTAEYVVATWEYENDTIERVCFSDASVATAKINEGGNAITVTALRPGKTNISVFTRKGSLGTVKIKVNGSDFKLKADSTIKDGRKTIGTVKLWPVSDDYIESVKSYDENVVTVSCTKDTFTIIPKNAGKTSILVTTHSGATAEKEVTVKDQGFKLDNTSLIFANMKKQTVRVKSYSPSDNKIRSVQSANEKIATATFKGDVITVKPHKKGKTTITVSTKKSTATIEVTVQ